MLKIYGYPNTRSLRATWMAEELGLDYAYQLVDLMQGDARKPDYLSVNPAGKVPALESEGAFIAESLAIINFLAGLKPDMELVPFSSTYRRARYDQWCSFALTELEQPLWTISKHKFALPKERRCAPIIETAAWEYQQALALFSEGLAEHDFILGEQFSGADILLAHGLFWGMAFKQPIEQENLRAYIGRAGVRPALAAARAREEAAKAQESAQA